MTVGKRKSYSKANMPEHGQTTTILRHDRDRRADCPYRSFVARPQRHCCSVLCGILFNLLSGQITIRFINVNAKHTTMRNGNGTTTMLQKYRIQKHNHTWNKNRIPMTSHYTHTLQSAAEQLPPRLSLCTVIIVFVVVVVTQIHTNPSPCRMRA